MGEVEDPSENEKASPISKSTLVLKDIT